MNRLINSQDHYVILFLLSHFNTLYLLYCIIVKLELPLRHYHAIRFVHDLEDSQ